jgi:DNA-binding MarR family transcriptional regulator
MELVVYFVLRMIRKSKQSGNARSRPAPGPDLAHELSGLIMPLAQTVHEVTGAGGMSGELTLRQMQALWVLEGSGPLLVGELGRRLEIAASTATELADRLVVAGYVARSENAADRRRKMLKVTAKGRAEARRGRRSAESNLRRRLAGISQEEQAQLLEAFHAIFRIFADRAPAAAGASGGHRR